MSPLLKLESSKLRCQQDATDHFPTDFSGELVFNRYVVVNDECGLYRVVKMESHEAGASVRFSTALSY